MDDHSAFRQFRFKDTERMIKMWVISVVFQFAWRSAPFQCSCQVFGVPIQLVFLAGDQHTGRQRNAYRRHGRVQIRIERMLLIPFAIQSRWKKQTDAVLPGGIKHSADQSHGLDLQIGWSDTSESRQHGIFLNSSGIERQECACTVSYHVYESRFSFEFRGYL